MKNIKKKAKNLFLSNPLINKINLIYCTIKARFVQEPKRALMVLFSIAFFYQKINL